MTEPQVKWTGRTDPLFAEVAEALGIDTDLVMAATVKDGLAVALYSPVLDAADPRNTVVWQAALERDVDNVLHVRRRHEVGRFGDFLPPCTP